jgi:hypothetical protein
MMLGVVHIDLLAPYVILDELLVWAMSLRTLISLDNRCFSITTTSSAPAQTLHRP